MRAFSHLRRGTKITIEVLGLVSCLIIVTGVAFALAYWQKILPGVEVLDIKAGNMTAEQLADVVEKKINESDWKVTVRYLDYEYQVSRESLGISFSTEETVNAAWYVGRSGNLIERVGQAWKAFFVGQKINIAIKDENSGLDSFTEKVAKDIDNPLVKPSFNLNGKKLVFVTGKDGLKTDKDNLKQLLRGRAEQLVKDDIEVKVSRQTAEASEDKIKGAKEAAESLVGKKLIFTLDSDKWSWGDDQLVKMLLVAEGGGFDESEVAEEVESLSMGINREPQNAALQFTDGKVSVFRPGKDGIEVIKSELVGKIVDTSQALTTETEVTLDVPVRRTEPQIATGDVNNLGIKELLGAGKSTYTHSIPNRIQNVALAASRINGVLVPPDTEFSFNEALGDVSVATGFLSAYVIQNGRTVLGDGGGVCQVSTTMFRAAMAAGLPILERKAHAYRVGYYEQDSLPGIDATVYAPSADLKFKNDTPGHLLIQTVTDSKTQKMTIEIYGTTDGRKSTVTTPKVWNQSPPPPTLYQDDPTLPVGTIKQVDWAAAGAKVSFDYKVERDGQEIFSKTFFSNYRPWQAIFLKGTKI